MSVSPQECLFHQTLGVFVFAPRGARLYRRLMLQRTQKMLREQFDAQGRGERQ
jgi:hypothetical protein